MSKRKNPAAVALGRKGGRVGGKSTSEAKRTAARNNGKKGGRPPISRNTAEKWIAAFAAFNAHELDVTTGADMAALAECMVADPEAAVSAMADAILRKRFEQELPEWRDGVARAAGFKSFADIAIQKAKYDRAH